MQLEKNYNLTALNTFGIITYAKFFVVVEDEEEIPKIFSLPEFKENDKLFLGGGSNILFTKDYDGIVVLNKLKGIEILKEDQENIWVKAMGGEVWHDLVLFIVEKGLWGIENLAFIPGTVGGSPMQNIGAYGAELKNTFESLEAYSVYEPGVKKVFNREECEFGYRESIFKKTLKGKYFITSVTLKLSKVEKKNTEYKVLKEYLEKNKIEVRNSKDVAMAVTEIRKSKLPDPKVLGNAGSFFKNIFTTTEKLEEIRNKYPDVPSFVEDGVVKIPSGWLIEKCDFKGARFGNVGVHDKQSLVLVNYGEATGGEVRDLAEQIILAVENRFGLKLSVEVNLI